VLFDINLHIPANSISPFSYAHYIFHISELPVVASGWLLSGIGGLSGQL